MSVWDGLWPDFVPVTTDVLYRRSRVVVTGTVTDVVAGRTDGQSVDDPFAVQNLGLAVRVDTVAKGDAVAAGEIVWIELPLGSTTVAEAQKKMPLGMPVAAFLDDARGSRPDYPLLDDGAGYPAGAHLWSPVGPQAFVLGYADTGTVTPLARSTAPSSTVDDALE